MALRDILTDIASTLGLDDLTNADRRQFYIDRINILAEELYGDFDFPDTLKEQVFQFTDEDSTTLALPYYVGNIKGVRVFNAMGAKVDLSAMRPRYHAKAWGTDLAMNWREKTKDSYVKRELGDFTALTFTLLDVETSPVTIDVSGKTDLSDRVSERVIIPAGDLSATTVMAYDDVKILKTARNTYNIIVTDINDNIVSEIPNHLLRPYYTLVQVRDANIYTSVSSSTNTFEVLYKERFFPMQELSDEFVAPNCDRMLFWKFAEWWESTQPGHEDRALLAKAKLDSLIADLLSNDHDGKQMEISFGPNRFTEIQKSAYDPLTNPYTNRYPPHES